MNCCSTEDRVDIDRSNVTVIITEDGKTSLHLRVLLSLSSIKKLEIPLKKSKTPGNPLMIHF